MHDDAPSRLGRRLDPLLDFLMRPRVRRVRRWSFLVTLPAGFLLGRALGIRPDLADGALVAGALIVLDLLVLVAIVVLGTRVLGPARREIVLDLFMHPAARRAIVTEARGLGTLVLPLARRLRRSRREAAGGSIDFSYHRGSSELGLAVALIPAMLAETGAVHLLLPERWLVVKIVVAALTVYGLLWMVALALGPRVHPHVLAGGELRVRLGSLYAADVPLAAIAAVEPHRERPPRGAGLSLRGDTALLANRGRVDVRIALREPVVLRRPFGEPVEVSELLVAADRPAELAEAVRTAAAAPAPDPTQARERRGGRWTVLLPTPAELAEAAAS